jgi:uncharacterized phage infection (PIP) family protein YhgE|tara:strand:- start:178 stop:750 length:573 start_codon:yes stop_codon:yes gene_type:complete
MSNDPVYSKQVLDNLKDGCEKVKTIFNNVETQRKQQQEFINKISNFDKEFSTMLDNMSKNLVQFNKIIENVENTIKQANEERLKVTESENKSKKIENLKSETKYLQEYHKLMEEHNKISLIIEEQKIKKTLAVKDLEKKYGVHISQKKKSSSKPVKNVDAEEHIRRRSTGGAHPLAAALKAKFKGARGED